MRSPRLLALALVFPAALPLAACHRGQAKSAAEAEEEAESKAWKDPAFRAFARRYQETLVFPQCGGHESAPAVQAWMRGPISGRQLCGLLANDFDEPSENSAIGAYCATSTADECGELVRATFRARLSERYHLADRTWLGNHCAGYPDDCASLALLELQWLKNHNEAAAYGFEQSVKRLEEERAYETAMRREKRRSRAYVGAAIVLLHKSKKND
jgi:hypothetical protein